MCYWDGQNDGTVSDLQEGRVLDVYFFHLFLEFPICTTAIGSYCKKSVLLLPRPENLEKSCLVPS